MIYCASVLIDSRGPSIVRFTRGDLELIFRTYDNAAVTFTVGKYYTLDSY